MCDHTTKCHECNFYVELGKTLLKNSDTTVLVNDYISKHPIVMGLSSSLVCTNCVLTGTYIECCCGEKNCKHRLICPVCEDDSKKYTCHSRYCTNCHGQACNDCFPVCWVCHGILGTCADCMTKHPDHQKEYFCTTCQV